MLGVVPSGQVRGEVLVLVVCGLLSLPPYYHAHASKLSPPASIIPPRPPSPPLHRHPGLEQHAPATFQQEDQPGAQDTPLYHHDPPHDPPFYDPQPVQIPPFYDHLPPHSPPFYDYNTAQYPPFYDQATADDDPPLYDHQPAYKVFYQSGKTEKELPVCSPWSVCNKVDTYESPRVERQCRCPVEGEGEGERHTGCSTTLDHNDGHTITDKTRQFKVCEPVRKLPRCRYFRDVTWTFITYPDNVTQQVMHCVCPRHAVAYIIKRQTYHTPHGLGFQYSFACSPQSKLRCQRKEPCRLFTVKKRPQFEDVNTNTLCQCPHSHTCPSHHTDPGVIPGKTYTEDSIRTFSGYCM